MRLMKLSKYVFWSLIAVTVAIMSFYFFGGCRINSEGNLCPVFLPMLLLFLAILLLFTGIVFLSSFFVSLIRDYHRQNARILFIAGLIIGELLLMFLFFLINNNTISQMPLYIGQDNITFWNRAANMFIHMSELLITIGVLLVFGFTISRKVKSLKK